MTLTDDEKHFLLNVSQKHHPPAINPDSEIIGRYVRSIAAKLHESISPTTGTETNAITD